MEDGSGILVLYVYFVLLFIIIEYDGCVIESVFWFFNILVDVGLLCVGFAFEDLVFCLLYCFWARPVGRAPFRIFVTNFVKFFVWFVFWFFGINFFCGFVVMLGGLIWLLFWMFVGMIR